MKLFQLLFYLLMNIAFTLLITTMIFNYGISALLGYLFIVLTNFFIFYLFSKNLVHDIKLTYEKINDNTIDNLNIDNYDYSNETKELLKKFMEHKNSTQVTHDEKTEKEAELKKSLETILNTTVDGIVFVNNTRDITIANESFFKLCGYRAFEISGKDKTSMVAPENVLSKNLIRFIKYSFETFETKKDNITIGTIEISHIKPNRILKATAMPLRYSEDHIDGIVINLKDITKEIEAETEKKKFISSISHEFRTPLFSIMGYSELLSEDSNDIDSIKLYSKTIHNEAIRLSAIIDNLFNTVLIDKEEFAISIEKINLKSFIENIVKEDLQKVKVNKISVVSNIDDNIGEILNSKESLSLVLVNLIGNMVKFSYENTQAEIKAVKKDKKVIISFTNYGDGISEEYSAKLFEKFSRAETQVHTLSGAGLGLFIARKIARIHGGDITFESIPKEKTVFYLTLPIKSKFDVNNFSSSTVNI